MANFLFTHNTMLGILTFGLGFMAGVPTLLLLGYQGVILGAFVALHYDRGFAMDFLGWVSIHGVTELGAIILCGAAGLLIATRCSFPGGIPGSTTSRSMARSPPGSLSAPSRCSSSPQF